MCLPENDSGSSTNMAERWPSLKSLFALYSTLTISLSHLLPDHWSDFFETCLRCSPSSLVVHARKWFQSVDKCGHRQPSLIFTVIVFLRNHWRNSVKIWHMYSSQCLDVSARKWSWSIDKYGRTAAIFKITNCPLLNTVTISLLHLLRDHWSDFFLNLPEMFPSGQVVHARKWFRSVDKYGRRQPSLIFTIIASPPKPQQEFCRNLAYEFLLKSRCVCLKMVLVYQRIWPDSGHL